MADDTVSATRIIEAPVQTVFAILANPTKHASIDGTGWVCEALDSEPLTAAGQIFRMSMYHPNHPDGSYQMSNRVQLFHPPSTISWEPGYDAGDGTLAFGGWIWRYDLTPVEPSRTSVTLLYDWSAVPTPVREQIGFPPFPPEHLDNSLAHLGEIATPGPADGRHGP